MSSGTSHGTDEITREQEYVTRLYTRLDDLRGEAETQLRGVLLGASGGTAQNRIERDVSAQSGGLRLAQLDAVENGLVFGGLDKVGGERHYVGRIGIRDDGAELEPLLCRLGAPAARAFYIATSAAPGGGAASAAHQDADADRRRAG